MQLAQGPLPGLILPGEDRSRDGESLSVVWKEGRNGIAPYLRLPGLGRKEKSVAGGEFFGTRGSGIGGA